MRSRESAYAFMRRWRQPSATEVLLERRSKKAALMPGMWELPAIDPDYAPEEKKALTVRHSITDTNYYVTIFDLGAELQRHLPKRKITRRWFPVRDLDTLPLTGLTRKVLQRLQFWPGFEGTRSAAPLERSSL